MWPESSVIDIGIFLCLKTYFYNIIWLSRSFLPTHRVSSFRMWAVCFRINSTNSSRGASLKLIFVTESSYEILTIVHTVNFNNKKTCVASQHTLDLLLLSTSSLSCGAGDAGLCCVVGEVPRMSFVCSSFSPNDFILSLKKFVIFLSNTRLLLYNTVNANQCMQSTCL